jgi:hypothetical protein
MAIQSRSLRSIALLAVCVVIPAAALAHPPFAPFDDTRFAPIEKFGPSIGGRSSPRG